ncbi:MAG TPA: hypothetical protein VF819_10615 [Nitrospira sp.]
MPRYGKQLIPKTKAAFLAALKRQEAKIYRRMAETFRPTGFDQTLNERRELALAIARDCEDTAKYIEDLGTGSAADRDSLLAAEYKRALNDL